VVTITALRGACVTPAEGIGGVKYGARPVHVDANKVEHVCNMATEWFTAVANAIGSAIEDRERTLASAPAVIAAIGAIGHELVQIGDPNSRASRREEMLDRLRLVKWDKSKAWEGIAGKFSPKGNFSVGGSKETAYAVYAALTDRSSEGYGRIRNASA
jgi:DNA sulfur modification protein DndB